MRWDAKVTKMLELNKIYNLDWIEGLKQLDDESIDVCMTSPPYWGLRDYGTATWIESNNPNCDHKVGRDTRTLTEKSKLQMGSIGSYGDEAIKNGHRCPKCNALRIDLQLGLESHPQEWINKMVEGLAILKKKLKKTGSLWLNVGDTYFGSISHSDWKVSDKMRFDKVIYSDKGQKEREFKSKRTGEPDPKLPERLRAREQFKEQYSNWLQPKQLMLMPSRLAIALQDNGWILRNDCIWHKVNPMPSSVKDRLNTTFEHIFHFVRSRKYYYDLDAIREPHNQSFKPFNVRVRDAERKGQSAFQYKASEDEIVNYKIRKDTGKIIDVKDANDRRNVLPYARTGIEYTNPSGKNPGDVYEGIPMYTDVDFWQITTQPFPEAHFATYPVKLCEKPIKATLPKEICVKCGFIRERITKNNNPTKPQNEDNFFEENKSSLYLDNKVMKRNRPFEVIRDIKYNSETIGWTSCNCNAGFRAGVICDPFAGAGTTFVAMYEYNPTAKFIGFELNQKYIDIAMQRLKPHMEQTRLSEIIN